MNLKTFQLFPIALSGCLISLGVLSSEARAQAQKEKFTVVEQEILDDPVAQADSQTFEIRINNGDVTVKRNGKVVPKDQIKNENGRIVVVDENGDVLKDLNMRFEPFHFNFDNGDFDKLKWFAGEQGPPPKVMLGVHMSSPDAALQYHLGLEPDSSAMIIGVYEGLAAREAGLNQHDVIVKVDGKGPATPAAIKEALANKEAGESITFTVIQKGAQRDVKIKLEAYDAEKLTSAKLIGVEPSPQIWSMFGDQDMGDFKNLYGPMLKDLPQLKGRELFVVPDVKGQKRELIAPVPEVRLRQQRIPSDNQILDKQLERLDERMADLETMLQKLIEREQQNR